MTAHRPTIDDDAFKRAWMDPTISTAQITVMAQRSNESLYRRASKLGLPRFRPGSADRLAHRAPTRYVPWPQVTLTAEQAAKLYEGEDYSDHDLPIRPRAFLNPERHVGASFVGCAAAMCARQ